eukprot:gene11957-biopygen375
MPPKLWVFSGHHTGDTKQGVVAGRGAGAVRARGNEGQKTVGRQTTVGGAARVGVFELEFFKRTPIVTRLLRGRAGGLPGGPRRQARAARKRQQTRAGREPDAGRTTEFIKKTDADRTRATPCLPVRPQRFRRRQAPQVPWVRDRVRRRGRRRRRAGRGRGADVARTERAWRGRGAGMARARRGRGAGVPERPAGRTE